MTETLDVRSIAFIYSLLDPDGSPRYVGQTVNLTNRLAAHWSARLHPEKQRNKRYGAWIASLDSKPTAKVLQAVPYGWRYDAEVKWITTLRDQGHDLVNISIGAAPAPKPPQRHVWAGVPTEVGELLDEKAQADSTPVSHLVRQIIITWYDREQSLTSDGTDVQR
ncbi:GIY-YIG nuclease family protein [Streptomyces sp. NPDC004232]|uniref:GIY-YIG nuclease family protein n=1 Tax=Streptomyces sp. NPDC004232 TaxID=3154454 RepID=UPI0033B759B0